MKDTESLILVALLRRPANGATVRELADAAEVAPDTVRNHLRVMTDHRTTPWVTRVKGWPPRWTLTMKGREVAGFRRKAT